MSQWRCKDCGKYWTSNAGYGQQFLAITRWCPECLPEHCPQWADGDTPLEPDHGPYHKCPVCWQQVSLTSRGNMCSHYDKIGHTCPMSGRINVPL